MKRCFTCKHNLPLFFFKKDRRLYQLKSNKGRLYSCKICNANRLYKDDGTIVRYNFEIKRFEVKQVTKSLKIDF